MLYQGTWNDNNDITRAGHYVRMTSVFDTDIGLEVIDAIATQPKRFVLIGSQSCPWSHRTMLMRQLKGLTELIPLHIAHGPRVQGYAADGGNPWRVPGVDKEIIHLHQLYTLSDPDYTGRSTVPILWDGKNKKIASNESAAIIRALDAVHSNGHFVDFTFAPDDLLSDIDELNSFVYKGLSNGVYRAVFAEKQIAYDAAIRDVFATLDKLESILVKQRYLLGSTITEADWRLFPTLLRFDAVYTIQHRVSLHRLTDYPNLWAYARDLYAWQGVKEALSVDEMRKASYANDPHGIIAAAPEADWHASHDRDSLGNAHIKLRSGMTLAVDPKKFLEQVARS